MNPFYTNFVLKGNTLLIRDIVNGVRSKRKVDVQPDLFVISRTETEYKNIHGQFLQKVPQASVSDARSFIKQYDGTGYEVFGFNRWEYPAINELFPGSPIDYDETLINISCLDIETECANGFPDVEIANEKINAISLSHKDKIYGFGLQEVDFTLRDDLKLPDNYEYRVFNSEEEMLEAFIDAWVAFDIDIITGWHIDLFDLPYLFARISAVLGNKAVARLSPWGTVTRGEQNVMGQKRYTVNILGISIIDYLDIYKKFKVKMQESYKLDHIAHIELGENKLNYDEYDSLHQLYMQDYTKFIAYNIRDVYLVQRLEEQLKFISLCMVISYQAKTNFDDVFSNVRLWDVIIANYLIEDNIVVPVGNDSDKDDQYEGAYVKDPIVGKYDHVGSFDLTSLYPSLIMAHNISPDTDTGWENANVTSDVVTYDDERMAEITADLKKRNLTMAANGTLYRRDKTGFLAQLMMDYFELRKSAKKQMIAAKKQLQEVEKALARFEQ